MRSEIRLGWILVSTARRNMLAVCAFTIAIACAVRAASSLARSSVLQVFSADGFQIHPGNWWRLDGLVRVGLRRGVATALFEFFDFLAIVTVRFGSEGWGSSDGLRRGRRPCRARMGLQSHSLPV